MSKRKTFVNEIEAELTMRRRVWQRVWGKADEFSDPEHQRRYNTLVSLNEMLRTMTDREVEEFMQRVERRKAEETSQQSLFNS